MTSELQYQLAVQAVNSHPGDTTTWYRLGVILLDLKRWGAAAGCFSRAVSLAPQDHRAVANLGWCLHLLGRHEEACNQLARAIVLAPNEAMPYSARAIAGTGHSLPGGSTTSVVDARRAVELAPDVPLNHMALAFALFAAGEWKEGWREYQWRFRYRMPDMLHRPAPLWAGEQVDRLWIEAEQGLGDTIFALRWIGAASEKVGSIILTVHRELLSWVKDHLYVCMSANAFKIGCPIEMKAPPTVMPEADAWCPIMSLPAALSTGNPFFSGTTRTEISTSPQYKSQRLRQVGICWAGNPDHDQAHHRDIPLAYWLRLAELPGVELHALQVGPRAADLNELGCHGLIHDRSPEITNIADTARLLDHLDLLISVDTAVAHLAGTLGMPTWLIINQRGCDFRWPGDGDSTAWYPSHRIWRRSLEEGSWAGAMERIAVELKHRPDVVGEGT